MIKEKTHLEYQEILNPTDEYLLFDKIGADAALEKGRTKMKTFGFFIKDDLGKILGGVTALIIYGSLYIDLLWVDEKLRHQGWGTKLALEAEKVGKDHLCPFATVNTMESETVPFFQKLGYELEFAQEGYEKNAKMHFLKKTFISVKDHSV